MRGLADARTGLGPLQGRAARRNRRRDRTASERAVKGGRYSGHRRRRRVAPLMAREWPLRQARAQQGPRCARRATGGRSLDRGRARRPGPRATDAEGTDRRNVAARPRSRRGAQPRRVGRGRARRPGGWGPWPAPSGHGWDPPPRHLARLCTSRADAQRAEARRAAALGAGATASGVPERAHRRPQAPNRAGAGPAPGWGPRTPRAKRWAAWWSSADPMVRAVPTRIRAEAWPASAKKNCVPDRTGDAIIQYQGPTPQSLGSGLRPSDHGRRNA